MGLFDVWDTFTDFVGDWWDAFTDKLDDIKASLWSWVDDIAKYWVKQADMFFDILKHTWSDVENLMEQAKSYADDIVTDAILKIDKWVGTFFQSYLSPCLTPINLTSPPAFVLFFQSYLSPCLTLLTHTNPHT